MTDCTLDGPIRIGNVTVAAVVRQQVNLRKWGRFGEVNGHKAPVAIVLYDGKALRASRPDGGAMTLEELEKLCPGAASAMRDG